jgi:DNA-binding SARP family transcriptional activator/RecA/RadA recombinase
MGKVFIGLLGPLVAMTGDLDVTPTQPKLRQLLALLALESGTEVGSEVIARELWNTASSPRNARIVQTYVSQLRGLLAGGEDCPQTAVIRNVSRVGYHLALDDRTTCDVDRAHRLLDAGGQRLDAGDRDGALASFEEALGLCRGGSLGGVPQGAVLRHARKRLETLRLRCFERTMRLQLELGRPELVLAQQERVVAEDLRNETLYAPLITALGATGQTSEAVELFHDVRRDTVARTGMEPGDLLQKAFLDVVQSRGNGLPAPAARPQPTPPRPSAPAPVQPPAPAQLPFEPPVFVGYAEELVAARKALTAPGRPRGGSVVTVVGGPGSGKTTFCTQLAHLVRDRYPGGQLHANMADRSTAEILPEFIAAVGVEGHALPGSLVERSRLFRRLTMRRPVLVLLDDVVDLADAAWLQPGCPQGSMILACRRRMWSEFVTGTVELREARDDELMAMLVARIGTEAVIREPEAARSVIKLAFGLPVAITSLTFLLRSRPHWSLHRLVERLTGDVGSRIEFALGTEQLTDIVETTLALVPAGSREALLRLCVDAGHTGPFSPAALAEVAGLRIEDAEQVIEDAVAIRIANPVVGAGCHGQYTLNALYRAAASEWCRRRPSSRSAGSDIVVTYR